VAVHSALVAFPAEMKGKATLQQRKWGEPVLALRSGRTTQHAALRPAEMTRLIGSCDAADPGYASEIGLDKVGSILVIRCGDSDVSMFPLAIALSAATAHTQAEHRSHILWYARHCIHEGEVRGAGDARVLRRAPPSLIGIRHSIPLCQYAVRSAAPQCHPAPSGTPPPILQLH
jgi:hypothetical protein